MYFEALLPRINAIVNLDEMDINKFNKNTRNKIKKGIRKGLVLEKADQSKIGILAGFLQDNLNRDSYFYNDLYNVFNKTDDVDYFLVKVNYKDYLINSQNYYNYELNRNSHLNDKMLHRVNANIINAKMSSDKSLLAYKNDIAEASRFLNSNITTYVAGAMVIKYDNRITIQISGFDRELKRYAANYFLYFAILAHYKNEYKYKIFGKT